MLNRTLRNFLCASLLASLIIAPASDATAAVFAGFDSATHDRFLPGDIPNPGFLIDESQLSGLALDRGVLITPQHYITATHTAVPSVSFRGTDGVIRTYNSDTSQSLLTAVPGEGDVASDIRIYRIASPVDPSIIPLPVAIGGMSNFVGHEVLAYDQNRRVGRNIIEAAQQVEFNSGNGDSETVAYRFDTDTNGGTGGLGGDEIRLVGGDSGHAALISIDGQIGVIGAHMGIAFVPEEGTAGLHYSFSTLLSPYESQLNAIVGADGYSISTLTVTAVPEPSSFSGLLLLTGCLLQRRRRPSAQSFNPCP